VENRASIYGFFVMKKVESFRTDISKKTNLKKLLGRCAWIRPFCFQNNNNSPPISSLKIFARISTLELGYYLLPYQEKTDLQSP
jgi:hypothetical protein